jgi:predicted NBD/HSP70 family sugar kinase
VTPRIGIDLGGTKIEVIALDEAGRVLLRRRVATPAGDYGATLDAVAALVADAERELGGRASVGVATPGALSPASGLLRNSNSVCLNGKPLKQDIERRLAREIRIANDANCFALSEAADGAGQGAQVVFGVILGTGVGGGVIVSGHLLHGMNAVAGEWGHNPLPWPDHEERLGPPCYCGKTGCIETFLSGPGLARDHERRSGERLDPPQIVERAAEDDAGCEAALQRYEARLAKSLATVINLLDPDVIVLGGGLSNIARLYSRVPALWARWVFSDVVNTRLLRNRHGDSGGVRGAAWLWH